MSEETGETLNFSPTLTSVESGEEKPPKEIASPDIDARKIQEIKDNLTKGKKKKRVVGF
jgi:hypothetical protein